MIQIQSPNHRIKKFALFELGFRPFFLVSGVFSIILMTIWFLHKVLNVNFIFFNNLLSVQYWHVHEMIFGFTMAVVAGFLLTAVRNWTGTQTINGKKLLLVVFIWLMARISFWIPFNISYYIAIFFNLLFLFLITLAICYPLYIKKQYNQIAVLGSKIIFIFIADVLFFVGCYFEEQKILYAGLILALFLIVALILVMSRRVVPFFIEKGLRLKVPLKNSRFIDIASLVIFLSLTVSFIIIPSHVVTNILAGIMALLHFIRLIFWYAKGILQKPLLWILYFGNLWIIVAFALMALDINYFSLSLHAIGVGAIGFMVFGMMTRVALGHTGRSIFNPPKSVKYIYFLLVISALVRVFAPMIVPTLYLQIIATSIVFWILASALFVVIYTPILIKGRIDGAPG
jgi:uncharacterized protein involved in response to NO